MSSSSKRTRVLVTGASGKTGVLVLRELLQDTDAFEVAANVRSDKAHQLMLALGVEPGNITRVDIAGGDAATLAALKTALQGCGALVICTSAVPEVRVLPTLLGGLGAWLAARLRRLLRLGAAAASAADDDPAFVPVATWRAGQTPAAVDYAGQVAQIDAALAAHVGHVVLVSSAGGCDPRHFLNHIDLVDVPGRHQVVLGVDDQLQRPPWRQRLKMPRGDLAALVVAALLLRDEGAGNRSVDVATLPSPLGEPTKTLQQFKQLFEGTPGNCNYSINDRTLPGAEWACR